METVRYLAGMLVLLPLLLLLWAVLASPAIIGFVLALRIIRRRRLPAAIASLLLAAAFALLAAPVPTPIITVFVPHRLAMFDATYYRYIWEVPMAGLWWWIVPSIGTTFGLSLAVAIRYSRPADKLS